ncbi:MAG: tetratricopeptide repeat protein [Flavobacterium sp.]|jgi:two-component system, NarL family, sensor kinase|nr:tetratricopeptide repeat protein [Flavobacterium sp.]
MKLFFLLNIYALLILNLFSHKNIITKEREKEASIRNAFFLSIQEKKDSILRVQYVKALTLFENKKYVEGLRLALALHQKSKKNIDVKIHYQITNLIADIYRKNREHKKAIIYYKISLKQLSLNLKDNRDSTYNNQKDLAKKYRRIGTEYALLKINDSAIFYYNKLAELNSLDDEVLVLQASSFSNLAGIYQKDTTILNHYEKAIDYAERAIATHKKRNNRLSQASAINNLANVYLLQGNFEKSKKKYFEGIKLIKRDTSSLSISIKADLYYNLAWAMRNLKEYEAYDYQEISYNMENDLRDDEMTQNIKRITGEYNVDVVRKAGEFEKQKAQNLTWIIGISSFSIILLLAFLLNQYKLRQKTLSLQLSKQELLQQQKLEKIRTEAQIRILNATLDGKETERKQIAETLHDNVSALLSSANLHLQACKSLFKGSAPIEVDKSQAIINEASHQIRDLSHSLVSSVLLKFGLSYAIKDMVEKYSNSQLEIFCEIKYIKRYDQDFEIKLFNISQELVNNILKHSEASVAKIILLEKNSKLFLTIQDNGKGFDKLQVSTKDGLGINQINARIHMMKGKFSIETKKDKGTLITIELPVYERELAKLS